MGCASSSELHALEQRVRSLEDRLQAPNDFTQERMVQALSEKYGAASNELLRLQKLLETIQGAHSLVAASGNVVKAARDASSVTLVDRNVECVAGSLGLVMLVGYARENLLIQRSGRTEKCEVVNPSGYTNVLGAVTYVVLPGDKFQWATSKVDVPTLPPAYCYYVTL